PILARWNIELPYQAANTNLNWNSEIFNTNSAYIQRNASGTGINILVAGHYQVNVKVLQYGMCDSCRGDVYLRKNGGNIGSMLGFGGPSPQQYFYHSFNNLYYFNAGDVITIYAESYPVHPGSSLEIVKLN
ncbi:MAG: hypothetical protein Q8K26_00365, partial [Candidatus Gracilibacteria bacterium]|nr:hypothetical protein [Candidatus Gracilibacteria bacterium]